LPKEIAGVVVVEGIFVDNEGAVALKEFKEARILQAALVFL